MKSFSVRYKTVLQVLSLSVFTWLAYILIQLIPLFFFDVDSELIKKSIIFISVAIVMLQVGQSIGVQLAMSDSKMLSFLKISTLNILHILLISLSFLFIEKDLIIDFISITLLLLFLFQGMLISRDYSEYIFNNQKTKYYIVVFIRNSLLLFLFFIFIIVFENIYFSFITAFLFANIISRHFIKPLYFENKISHDKYALLFITFATICSLAYRNDTNIIRSYISPIDFEFFHIVLTLFSGLVAMLGILAVTFLAPKIKSGQLSVTQIKKVTIPLFLVNTAALIIVLNTEFGTWLDLIIFFVISCFILLLSSLISVYLHTKKPSLWVYTSGLIGISYLIIELELSNTNKTLEILLSYLYLVSILLFVKFIFDTRKKEILSAAN